MKDTDGYDITYESGTWLALIPSDYQFIINSQAYLEIGEYIVEVEALFPQNTGVITSFQFTIELIDPCHTATLEATFDPIGDMSTTSNLEASKLLMLSSNVATADGSSCVCGEYTVEFLPYYSQFNQ